MLKGIIKLSDDVPNPLNKDEFAQYKRLEYGEKQGFLNFKP